MVGLLLTNGSASGIVGALLANRVRRRFGTVRELLLLQAATAPVRAAGAADHGGAGATAARDRRLLRRNGRLRGQHRGRRLVRQTYCPPHLLGRVVATTMMPINRSTIPVGSLLGGVLGDAIGYRRRGSRRASSHAGSSSP